MTPRIALTFLVLLTQLGCALVQVRQDNERLGPLSEFEGTVDTGGLPLEPGRPIVVLLVREGEAERKVVASSVLYRPGRYHFYANEGRYSVFAFADLNSNLHVDDGEPRAVAPRQLLLRAGKLRSSVDLTLGSGTQVKAVPWNPPHDELITIADYRLRERMGRKGHWAPVEWRKESGDDRMYLLEPFDPDRIPVVFVPGVGGTPEDLQYVIGSLDHSRYQVWIFWYASGMRMSLSAQALKSALDEFRVLHEFSDVVMVSQCVGGMIARDAIAQLQDRDHRYEVRALVTFSTPWGGHHLAQGGTTFSPMTVPAWYDMAAGSEFQKRAIATALPSLQHYLFFSYGEDGDDGTVSLASMLELTMQRRATEVIGYGVDHMGVVQQPEPLQHFNEVLERVREKVATSGPKTPDATSAQAPASSR